MATPAIQKAAMHGAANPQRVASIGTPGRVKIVPGKHLPKALNDYTSNGNRIGGFAFVTWPAKYRDSGTTFIINSRRRFTKKNLGPKTECIAVKMKAYRPHLSWTEVD